ncbi:hypothetical protein ACJRO7_026558, partial [Eucalyptus globulus]
ISDSPKLISSNVIASGDVGAAGLHQHILVHGDVDGLATDVVAFLDNLEED